MSAKFRNSIIYPWQEKHWDYCVARIKQHNFPHALLLKGMAGLGKREFASTLAKLLLCKQPTNDQACGECSACQLFAAGNHPDFFDLHPEEKSSQIKIEQIRDLTLELSQTAQQMGHQVVIIEPAEAMNVAASNALLKTLEEPHEKIVIILVSEQASVIPATIRSRCQHLVFNAPTVPVAKKWLNSKLGNAQNLELLLTLSDNSPLEAFSLANSDEMSHRQQLVSDFLALSAGKLEPLKFAEQYQDAPFKVVLRVMQSIIADLIKLKFDSQVTLTNLDQSNSLKSISKQCQLSQLFLINERLQQLKNHLNKNLNINKQLFLESLVHEYLKSFS